MRILRLGSILGVLLVLTVAPVASAAAPPTTVITIDITFGGAETFSATGGVVCDSGTAVTDPIFIAGFGRMGRGVGTFHLTKTLACDDGSGTFKLLVNAATAPSSPGTLGGFAVGRGTGDYEGLHGAGSLVGTAKDGGIIDVYTGTLTNR